MHRILMVDDDAVGTEMYARMLRLEGYDVMTASNIDAGLREAKRFRPEVVLIELRLPVGDGITFIEQLRKYQDHGGTPVAVITGDHFVDEAIVRKLKELGAELHFKPLLPLDLVGITQRLLQRPS